MLTRPMKLPIRLFALIILTMLPIVGIEAYDEIDARSLRAEEGKDQALRLVRLVAMEQARVIEGAHQLLTALSEAPAVRSGDAPACSAFLGDLSGAYKQYASFMSIDLTGRSVCVGRGGTPGGFFGDRPYFKLALANREFVLGEYDVDPALRRKVIYLAQPYYGPEGKIAGVVTAGLSLDWLNGELARDPLPPKATVSAVDREGTIIARYPGQDRFVGTKIPGQSHSYMLSGGEGVQEALGFDGIARIYSYAPLPDGPPGLTLSVGLDKSEVLKGIETENRRDILVIAGSSILALLLAGIGARMFISRPIKTLLDTAEHWRQGDLNVRVPCPETRSEFGRLGSAFNDMAVAVANREQELERRVQERTEALKQAMEARHAAEAALLESRKMETVGRLTGGVAHDFNNILAAVVGNIELACARLGPSDAKLPWLNAAIQSANRGAALVQQLLAFARRQNLRPQAVDLNRHIGSSLDMLQRLLRSDVRVQAKLAPGAWLVRVDPSQLEAALLNLAINARDAMPHGGTLRLETANATLAGDTGGLGLNGDFVAITVTDTGTGIPPDVLEKVFEPFFTTKAIGAGSGLGLSMVQGFAQQSSGAVSIDSQVGRGTTVTLYLPRTFEALSPAQGEAEDAIESVGTILLVDDDPEVRSVTGQLLEMSGFAVIVAGNASEAMACFEQAGGGIDLLVTDLVLADGPNGIALASAIREQRPDLPVLLITGYSDALLTGLRTEGMDVLTKPFAHKVLMRSVRRVMRSVRRDAALSNGATSR
jgi:signal transduction histidine kinase/ActR/RegA family two-component response regulator